MQTALINDLLIQGEVKVPADMMPALRSDHAGETGAVYIYRGICAVSFDASLRAFAREHQATEERHLAIMNQLVPQRKQSRLLVVWRAAGWITGALPALFGAEAVYRTIDTVESFVDQHYLEQIDALRDRPDDQALRGILESCRADELLHRDEARSRVGSPGRLSELWGAIVGLGSRAGVYVASRI